MTLRVALETILLLLAIMSFLNAFRSTSSLSTRRSVSLVRSITTSVSGEELTTSFRVNYFNNDKQVSPWHDISLKSGDHYNLIIEIPKFSKAKMEVSTKELFNPIAQDLKKGKLRNYHGPIFWNYGMFPQTWENPTVLHPTIKCKGDNDPLDAVEIGSKIQKLGAVVPVKVLGVLAMIDDGELDWKVITIDASDPLAEKLNDVADVDIHCPGVISGVREWFRWYKTPDGKKLNAFGYDEKALSSSAAVEVIEETNHFWKDLTAGKLPKGDLWIPGSK